MLTVKDMVQIRSKKTSFKTMGKSGRKKVSFQDMEHKVNKAISFKTIDKSATKKFLSGPWRKCTTDQLLA